MEEPKKKKKGKGCLIAILVVVGLAVIGSIFGSGNKKEDAAKNTTQTEQAKTEEKQEEKKDPIKVSATEISKVFEANELKGKETYTGKYAEITGTVQSIDEMMGKKFVVLNGDESDPGNIVSVQCFFEDENAKGLADLQKGQSVTIVGTIGEKSINVGVDDCKLVQ